MFARKGLKFTILDVAKDLHIAKKTIYQFYDSKEALMIGALDYGFQEIHAKKRRILEIDLPVSQRIEQVMIAMPDQYSVFDFRQLSDLKERYPAVYKRLRYHLESDWEPVIQLLESAQENHEIRRISIPVLRTMITASFEAFLSTNNLRREGIRYNDALHDMMDILMNGIKEEEK